MTLGILEKDDIEWIKAYAKEVIDAFGSALVPQFGRYLTMVVAIFVVLTKSITNSV